MLKGLTALESTLVSRNMGTKGLPSMKLHMPHVGPSKLGMIEHQPKVKPLAQGFHNSFFAK